MPNLAEMNTFELLELAAWAISLLLGLWMIVDMIRTNTAYSDDVLLSSREGEIEDELIIDPTHRG
ncbi:MAG: hypothetical protein R3D51_09220 [Hyphomicrobiaceae bacterium]|jgi:hypothetical protein